MVLSKFLILVNKAYDSKSKVILPDFTHQPGLNNSLSMEVSHITNCNTIIFDQYVSYVIHFLPWNHQISLALTVSSLWRPSCLNVKELAGVKGGPSSLSVPGYTISIPHSNLSPSPLTRLIFQPRLPFIKNRFQKALLPRDSTRYKSNRRNAPLHHSPLLTQSIHYHPKLPVYLQTLSWEWDEAVDKQAQTGVKTHKH